MVSPMEKADGMIVTTTEIDFLEKSQIVKMIPIKMNLQSDRKEDFFII